MFFFIAIKTHIIISLFQHIKNLNKTMDFMIHIKLHSKTLLFDQLK